jgi:hypothetical protein
MTDRPTPCSSAEARQFDFWIGEWDLSWPAEQAGGVEGLTQTGRNTISRLFGPCVIEENFTTDDGRFRGHSVSVFDEEAGLWRQTWVDSSGGYLVFTGSYGGDTMELRTEPTGNVIQRMVFSAITQDSLEWAWQGSRDGGDTWDDLWNISYRRHQ